MTDGIIALTGATGFVGSYLLRELTRLGYRVRVLLRTPRALPANCTNAIIGDLDRPMNMAHALADVTIVIHSAGLAATMTGSPSEDFRRLNTLATGNLARAAQRAGVKRFIFMSSLRAQADASTDTVLTEDLLPSQRTPMDIPNLPQNRNSRGSISTGWPFDSPWSLGQESKAHGKSHQTRPITASAAPQNFKSQTLFVVSRQSGRGCTGGGCDAATTAAPSDRGGSRPVECRSNDHGDARRTGASARPFLPAEFGLGLEFQTCRPFGAMPTTCRATRCRSVPPTETRLGAAFINAGCTRRGRASCPAEHLGNSGP